MREDSSIPERNRALGVGTVRPTLTRVRYAQARANACFAPAQSGNPRRCPAVSCGCQLRQGGGASLAASPLAQKAPLASRCCRTQDAFAMALQRGTHQDLDERSAHARPDRVSRSAAGPKTGPHKRLNGQAVGCARRRLPGHSLHHWDFRANGPDPGRNAIQRFSMPR